MHRAVGVQAVGIHAKEASEEIGIWEAVPPVELVNHFHHGRGYLMTACVVELWWAYGKKLKTAMIEIWWAF